MNLTKSFALWALVCLLFFQAKGQIYNNRSNATRISTINKGGDIRNLQPGTLSNRDLGLRNDGTTGTRTWTFNDESSVTWDTEFYGSKTTINTTALYPVATGAGSINSGSTTFTRTSGSTNFVSGDVGKIIKVAGAGSGGAVLVTTIAGRTSNTVVTLATAASTTVSSKNYYFGTGGAMTSGSAILTHTSASFQTTDIGKAIEVYGAGPSGATLVTTILSRQSTTQVTLNATASTTVGVALVNYGWGGAMTAGSAVLSYNTSSTANFTSADVGKTIKVTGAGPGGSTITTTIAAFTNSKTVTLAAAATNTVTVASIRYGAQPAYAEGHYSHGWENDTNGSWFQYLQYRLLTPKNYNPVENYKYPMVIMIHGAGEGADCWGGCTSQTSLQYLGNDLHLLHGGQVHLDAVLNTSTGANGKKAEDPTLPSHAFPGFVLFPQTLNQWPHGAITENMGYMIDMLIQTYNIDPDRIYIHGLSNGGAGAWEILRQRPELFAAVLPMSATIAHTAEIFTSEVSKAIPVPAWIFQGGLDGSPTPNNTGQEVSKLKAAGALPRYTIYQSVGHGTWGYAYAEPDFFSWMLKKNKSDIQVLFGDSTLCATNGDGAKLAVSTGFLAYQWEKDGVVMGSPYITSTINVTQAGIYRARYSRISATPTEAQWNKWSKPVTIRETSPVTPVLTTVGTPHLPDVYGGTTAVRINGPTTKDLTKNWYVNGVLSTSNPNMTTNGGLDTAYYTIRNTTSTITLKTIPLSGCPSLESNPIYVTTSTPTGLTPPANPQTVVLNSSSIQLFWTDNTPNETGFEIFRSTTGSNGSYNFYKLVNQGTTSYTDNNLTPGTTYYYQLRAVNNTTVSTYVSTTATAGADTQPPTAPQNLVAASRTLSSITLSWTASTDNNAIAQYKIYYDGNIIPTNSTATSYTLTDLDGNTNYMITVKAVDVASNESQPSNQLATSTYFSGLNYTYSTVNVDNLTEADQTQGGAHDNRWMNPEKTGIVSNFSFAPRTQDDYFNFSYTGYLYITQGGDYQFRTTSDDGSMLFLQGPFFNPNPDFTTYRIVNNDGLHGDQTITSTVQTLPDGTAQQISVIFFEKTGGQSLTVEYKGPDTGDAWVVIPDNVLNSGLAPGLTPPAAPTGLVATSGGMTSINLTWNAVAAANSYEVYRSIGSTNSYSIVASPATNSYTDTGLLPSTSYTYKVKSISNTDGSSLTYSNTSSATTAPDTQSPTVPQGVTILSSNYTNAGLTWSTSTDNVSVVGYKIYGNGSLLGTSTTNTFYTNSLLPGTLYNMTVSAYDNATPANESAQSTAASFTTNSPLTFYSKPSPADLTQLTSWTANSDGTGSTPPSFAYNGQYFTVQNSQTLSTALSIGGDVSRIIVDNGASLTISQPLTGTIKVNGNGVVNVNTNFEPVFETLSSTSTVNFNTYTSVPIGVYGNLTLNGSGLKNVVSGTLEVQGDLTLNNGVGINGGASNSTIVKIGGSLITGSTVAKPSGDNLITLQFANAGTHNITVSNDQFFYKINATTGTVVFNNTSGSAKTLNLGSLNGGGLDLSAGSTLSIGNNSLTFSDVASINPTNTTGEIAINNGSIQLTTSSASNSNFYFKSGSNSIQSFTLQSTGGATTYIRNAAQIFDGIKINSGVLNSSGNITIKSSSTASASVREILSGSITGAVKVERYMAPKGRLYRYLSTPQTGIKVADWQTYIPITGNFVGTSTGAGLSTNPSMFYYTEPNYITYPLTPTTSNQSAIQVGRGYAVFIREGVNPTTLLTSGDLNQGDISFTSLLTGGTGITSDGWNLLGNPYASDIVWNNTGWTSSGIGNVISVSENLPNGQFNFKYWDRSLNGGLGGGTLENGKIPAGQAFWVQASTASPTLIVKESAKTTESAAQNTEFYRTGTDPLNTFDYFSFEISNGTYSDKAFVKLRADGKDEYIKATDGEKRSNSYFNLSTLSVDNVPLAMNELSNSFCEKVIPVKLDNIASGTYTMKFDLSTFKVAQLVLVDNYLTQNSEISSTQSEFTFTVNTQSASYQNRFSLKLQRPNISTAIVASATKSNLCTSDQNAVINIVNSQVGVEYQVMNSSSATLSEKIAGTGDSIQLIVPVSKLTLNDNFLKIQASYPGCGASFLNKVVSIGLSSSPTLAVTNDLFGCVGSSKEISVASTGSSTFRWQDAVTGKTLPQTDNKISVSSLNEFQSFTVTAINEKGCESEPVAIRVRADSLDTPEIIMVDSETMEVNLTNNIQWLFNGVAIEGVTSERFKPSESGSYSVRSQNSFCVKDSEPVDFIVTGLEKESSQLILQVYPNPSNPGEAKIKGASPSQENLKMQLIDMTGKERIHSDLTYIEYNRGVDLPENIPVGIYLVRITQKEKTVYKKLVIH